jgi:hypothetical protein
VAMFHFLRVWWLTQCKIRWIPDARSYDRTILELAATLGALLDTGLTVEHEENVSPHGR